MLESAVATMVAGGASLRQSHLLRFVREGCRHSSRFSLDSMMNRTTNPAIGNRILVLRTMGSLQSLPSLQNQSLLLLRHQQLYEEAPTATIARGYYQHHHQQQIRFKWQPQPQPPPYGSQYNPPSPTFVWHVSILNGRLLCVG